MASKSPQAFRTIREVADWLAIEAHVLRFWESKFTQIKPVKRAGGRRYYRPADMRLVGGIKVLLHDQGLTIRGVQKMIREDGVGKILALSPDLDEDLLDGEVMEVEAAPDTPIAAASGFFDVDAMAAEDAAATDPAKPGAALGPTKEVADEPEPESVAATAPERVPEETATDAPTIPAAPVSPPEEVTPDVPEIVAPPAEVPTAPISQTASEQIHPESLSTLRALVAKSGPLSPEQYAALAPQIKRLQGLADRLTAKARSA